MPEIDMEHWQGTEWIRASERLAKIRRTVNALRLELDDLVEEYARLEAGGVPSFALAPLFARIVGLNEIIPPLEQEQKRAWQLMNARAPV